MMIVLLLYLRKQAKLKNLHFDKVLHLRACQGLLHPFLVLNWVSLDIPSDGVSFLDSDQKFDEVF